MTGKFAAPIAFTLCGALLASGCAKQQLVKKEEPLSSAAAASSAAVPPAPTAAASGNVRTEPVRQEQAAQAAPAPAAEKPAPTAPALVLEKIFFDFDSTVLSAAARETLARDAGLIRKATPVRIVIEGHCDERGSDEYNLALGEKRASAARQYLVTLGVAPERLSVISYGKERPADSGHDESAWSRNRRDEFVVSAK